MAELANGLHTADTGCTTTREVFNANFELLDPALGASVCPEVNIVGGISAAGTSHLRQAEVVKTASSSANVVVTRVRVFCQDAPGTGGNTVLRIANNATHNGDQYIDVTLSQGSRASTQTGTITFAQTTGRGDVYIFCPATAGAHAHFAVQLFRE